jgi:pimeloyl-ACP methyl ester carboxylesterase
MTERVLVVDGVELCVEAFGSPDDPTVLLIAGGAQSMVWWEDGWCRLLAAGGRFVVRYDHRPGGGAGRPLPRRRRCPGRPGRRRDHRADPGAARRGRPAVPVEHGRALARLVPGARLVELPGVGHEQPPPPRWDLAAAAVLDRTAGR